jgi:thiamine biosynthesis lipoprotein
LRIRFIPFLLLLLLAGCATRQGPRYQRFEVSFTDLFDTVTVVIGYAENREEFDRYTNTIYARLKELHRLYDIYNEYGGVNNLRTVNNNAGIAPVAVDPDIIGMLLLARQWHGYSGGAVNVALGPVLRIWHEYRADGTELPPVEKLRKAAELTDIDDVVIDQAAGTVFLKKPGMSLDVGSVAKSYAAGLAVKAAEEAGMRSALVSAGGNIVPLGLPLDDTRESWSVGIQDPDKALKGEQGLADTVSLTGGVVSCSGGYQRFYTVDGVSYHHIIDPATLMPAERYKQVVVIHPDAGAADLLSTALFILPYEEGAALVKEHGAEAFWMGLDGVRRATEGYDRMSGGG